MTAHNSNAAATSAYTARGFADRKSYLIALAESTGVSFTDVQCTASLLGPSEDFTGLVGDMERKGAYLAKIGQVGQITG